MPDSWGEGGVNKCLMPESSLRKLLCLIHGHHPRTWYIVNAYEMSGTWRGMMACSHPVSQCKTLCLAYSRHSINAACVYKIAEQELAGHHPAWRALPGLPGSAGALLSPAGTRRLLWPLPLRARPGQRCPAGTVAHPSFWPLGSGPAAPSSSGTWRGPSRS